MSKRDVDASKRMTSKQVVSQIFGNEAIVWKIILVLVLMGWTADTLLALLVQVTSTALNISAWPYKTWVPEAFLGGLPLIILFYFVVRNFIRKASKLDETESLKFLERKPDRDRKTLVWSLSPMRDGKLDCVPQPSHRLKHITAHNIACVLDCVKYREKRDLLDKQTLSEWNWLPLMIALQENNNVDRLILITTADSDKQPGSHRWMPWVEKVVAMLEGRTIKIEHFTDYLDEGDYSEGIVTTKVNGEQDELGVLAPRLLQKILARHDDQSVVVNITGGLAGMSAALAVSATLWDVPVEYIHTQTFERYWTNAINIPSQPNPASLPD